MMKKLLLLGLLLPLFSSGQIFSENFEGTLPPAGWVVQQSNANETWTFTNLQPINGQGSAIIDYDEALGQQNEWLISPTIDLSNVTSAYLSFTASLSYYWSVDPNDNYDFIVKASSNGGTTWTTVWTEENGTVFGNFTPFTTAVDISAYAGNANVKLAFQYLGADGAQVILDDIAVTADLPVITCSPSFYSVEPITNVTIANINNNSSADDELNSYEDYTNIIGVVSPGQNLPITVAGNTAGDYDNYISAYVDWNQNGNFGDAGEYYEIGMITNSTGTDGIVASGNIVVPANALVGPAIMRIVKNYDEYAAGPCPSDDDFNFGQVEDYTLAVTQLAVGSFDAAKFRSYPNPMATTFNIEYSETIDGVTIYNLLGQAVREYQVNSTTASLDVSELAAGAYIVKVISGGSVNTIKVVKQ